MPIQNSKINPSEENKGVWELDINPSSLTKTFIHGSSEKNKNISYDIEGLSIYRKDDLAYLMASSQGNFSYAVFDINNNNKYLSNFKIISSKDIDE